MESNFITSLPDAVRRLVYQLAGVSFYLFKYSELLFMRIFKFFLFSCINRKQ